jgi:hypothetical protein
MHHKSSLAIDYWERDDPLKFFHPQFFRIGKGSRGLTLAQVLGAQYRFGKRFVSGMSMWPGAPPPSPNRKNKTEKTKNTPES